MPAAGSRRRRQSRGRGRHQAEVAGIGVDAAMIVAAQDHPAAERRRRRRHRESRRASGRRPWNSSATAAAVPSFSQNTSSPVAAASSLPRGRIRSSAGRLRAGCRARAASCPDCRASPRPARRAGRGRAADQCGATPQRSRLTKATASSGIGKAPLQAAPLDHPAAEIDQHRVQRAAPELDPDRVGAVRVEAQHASRAGRGRRVRLPSVRTSCWLLELAHDLPGGVVGQLGVAGEIGFGGLAEATQQGEDHPLVVLADLHRVAALTRRAVAHSTLPLETSSACAGRHATRLPANVALSIINSR